MLETRASTPAAIMAPADEEAISADEEALFAGGKPLAGGKPSDSDDSRRRFDFKA